MKAVWMAVWRREKGSTGVIDTAQTFKRDVGAEIEITVTAATILEFQIAIAPQPGAQTTETLEFQCNGEKVDAQQIIGEHGTRIHRFPASVGTVTASYQATVLGRAEPPTVRDLDMSTYLRPSRYAEADKFFGFASTEFGQYADSVTILEKVSSWVGTRLDYVLGSSDPIDGAADTLLADPECAGTTPIW